MTAAISAGLSVTGDEFDARLPGRKATSVATTNTEFTTTETVLDTVSTDPDSLVIGERYQVRYRSNWSSTVNNDQVRVRIRQDSGTGTILLSERIRTPVFADTVVTVLEIEFTAAGTSATFVVTGERTAGTGTITRRGAAEQAVLFRVDKV